MRATPILPASQAAVNSQQTSSVSFCSNQSHSNDSMSSHHPTYRLTAQIDARDDLNGIATVLCGHWEHLRPGQALQLIVRALENCKPFVPGELGGIIDLIAHGATRVRYRRDDGKGSVAG